jgi:hypothetical protein
MKSCEEAGNVLTGIYENYPGVTNDFLKLAEISLYLENKGLRIKDVNSDQMATLLEIATHGPDGTGAQLALAQLFHKKVDHTPYHYNPNSAKNFTLPHDHIKALSIISGMTIYPNPLSEGDATVLIDGPETGVHEIKIYDMVGQVVNSIPVPENAKLVSISGKSLPGNGLYMISLYVNGKKISSKQLVVTK